MVVTAVFLMVIDAGGARNEIVSDDQLNQIE